MTDTALARNGTTSILGKLDDKFEGFRIESTVKARFAQIAAARGKPPAELLRDVVRVIALGPEEMKRMHCEQVDEVARMLAGMSDKGT